MIGRPPISTLFPYTTLSRSRVRRREARSHKPQASGQQPESTTKRERAMSFVLIMAIILSVSASLFFSTLTRSEEHTSELQSQSNLVCRLLLEKKKYHVSQLS